MTTSAIHTRQHALSNNEEKTVVVLGGSYAGFNAAATVAEGVPHGWRVILIDRNSHINHVYTLPRYSVLPGHEYKAFIPYDRVFANCSQPDRHEYIHGIVTDLSSQSVTFKRLSSGQTETIPFNYAIYALGSHLPSPINLWDDASPAHAPSGVGSNSDVIVPNYSGNKPESIAWLKRHQAVVEKADCVLVVGGGALGVQYASDIAAVHPSKTITLLHSRQQLLPRFDIAMHNEIVKSLKELDVALVLNERLDLGTVYEDPPHRNPAGQRIVKTVTGREIAADLILLCTGQKPNTELLKGVDERVIVPESSQARVLRTLQLTAESPGSKLTDDLPARLDVLHVTNTVTGARGGPPSGSADSRSVSSQDSKSQSRSDDDDDTSASTSGSSEPELENPYSHIFVVGDAADAFGAIQAGHTAHAQARIAARNTLKLIQHDEEKKFAGADRVLDDSTGSAQLEEYHPGPPGIKVSLGLRHAVSQREGIVVPNDAGVDDLNAAYMWKVFGHPDPTDEDTRL